MRKNLLSKLMLIAFMMVPLLMTLSGTATAGWTSMNSGTTYYLGGVWGSSGTDVFAVGGSGTILHYDGTNWSAMTSGTAEYLYGVCGAVQARMFLPWVRMVASSTTMAPTGLL